MKKVSLCIAVIAAIVFSGCKKNISNEHSFITDKLDIGKLQLWYELQTTETSKINTSFSGRIGLRSDKPVWSATKYYAASSAAITPIEIGNFLIESNTTVSKFLLTRQNPQGDINKGTFIYVIPDKSDNETRDSDKLEYSFTPDFLLQKKIPESFSGTIIEYDMNYKPIYSKRYKKGYLCIGSEDKLVAIKSKKPIKINSIVPLECGECIEWWDITYNVNTGAIISEVYVYTECGDCDEGGSGGNAPTTPGGGSGGGTGNGTTSTICNTSLEQGENVLNALTPAKMYQIFISSGSEVTDPNGVIRKPKLVNWNFFSLHFFGNYTAKWAATFNGVGVKANSLPKTPWKWESLTYNRTVQSGEVPPCFAATMDMSVTPPVISADGLRATVALTYSATVKLSCIGGWSVKNYSDNFDSVDFLSNSEFTLPY